MFQRRLSWQLCLRAIWLAIALSFSVCNLMAEYKMAQTVSPIPQSPDEVLAEADASIAWFPFDVRLRDYRRWVRKSVYDKVTANAASQRKAEESDVRGGGGSLDVGNTEKGR